MHKETDAKQHYQLYVPPAPVPREGGLHRHSAVPVLLSSSLADQKVSCTPETDAEETSTDININKLGWFISNRKLEVECGYNIICPLRQEHKREF